MSNKLIKLSLFLDENCFSEEALAVKKIANEVDELESKRKEVLDILSRRLKGKTTIGPEKAAELQKWEKLHASIDKPFNYEVNLARIGKALGLKADNLRSKSGIPEANPNQREKALKLLREGVTSISKADDQELDDSEPQEIGFDLEKVKEETAKSVASIIEDLSENEAAIVTAMIKDDFLVKEAFVGKLLKGIGSKVGKMVPFIGVAISAPLFLKNVSEAYNNSLKIFKDLPLEDYGLSVVRVMSPTAGTVDGTLSIIDSQIDKHSNDPDKLLDILEIVSVVKAYQLDVVFAITNGISFVLDLISLAMLAFPEPTGLTKVLAGIFAVADFIIQLFFLMGAEFASESISESIWSTPKEEIRQISANAIKRLKSNQPSKDDQPLLA